MINVTPKLVSCDVAKTFRTAADPQAFQESVLELIFFFFKLIIIFLDDEFPSLYLICVSIA